MGTRTKDEEIRRLFSNPYKLVSDRILGYGSFSRVVPVVVPRKFSTMTRKTLVAKVLRLESDDELSEPEQTETPERRPVSFSDAAEEVRILRKLQASNKVVKMIDAFELHEEVWIVMEHLPMDLHRLTSASENLLDISMIALITSDLVDALAYMHSHGVVHLDVKPLNVLLSKQGKVKLCDFGFAQEVDESGSVCLEVAIGSKYYVAPEILFGTHSTSYDYLVDVWSLGVVVHEMFSGRSLFTTFYNPKDEESNAFTYKLWIEYQKSNACYEKALLGVEGVDYSADPQLLDALKGSSPRKADDILGQTDDVKAVYKFLRDCLVPLPKRGPVVCPVDRDDAKDRATAEQLKESELLKMFASLEHSTRKKLSSLVRSAATP